MGNIEQHTPSLNYRTFRCPHCQVVCDQAWYQQHKLKHFELQTAFCAGCKNSSVWVGMTMVFPDASVAVEAHPDMPADVKKDFNEARSVVSRSPRSAAALLRLALQRLLPHIGGKGKHIDTDIAELVKAGASPSLQQAMDVLRVVGNNAVHPGQMTQGDTELVAHKLFHLLNILVEQTITREKEVQGLFDKLPQGTKDAIEKRDKMK